MSERLGIFLVTGERQISHIFTFKNYEKDYTVHYGAASLIPVPGKIKEQESISGLMKKKKVIWNS